MELCLGTCLSKNVGEERGKGQHGGGGVGGSFVKGGTRGQH